MTIEPRDRATIRTRPVACNVCGSRNAMPLFAAKDLLHGFAGTFQYVKCQQCGLVYMNPQIVPEQLPRLYPDDYAPHQSGTDGAPQPNQPESQAKNRQPKLPKFITASLNARSRVLDVGCGNGTFLHRVRKRFGCEVFGVDLSENAVRCAKEQYGLELFRGQVHDAPYADNSFDLVTAWSCFEHLDEPAAAVHKMHALCKHSGWLLIKTPNYRSFAAQWFKDKWYHLDCPRHLHLFSPMPLTALLEQHGFRLIRISHARSSKGWRASLQYSFHADHPWTQRIPLWANIISGLTCHK